MTGLNAYSVARPFPSSVQDFLVKSEQRVLEHCQRMLQVKGLANNTRQTLLRLESAARRNLGRLEEQGLRHAKL
jgi:hypothetical protein